jgi:hypothetical protein
MSVQLWTSSDYYTHRRHGHGAYTDHYGHADCHRDANRDAHGD